MHRNDVENVEFLIYTASPLFTEDDLKTCETVENLLNSSELDYFAPRFGTAEQGKELVKANSVLTDAIKTQLSRGIITDQYKEAAAIRDKMAKQILDANLKAINNCKLMIANVDNRDAGTMFEIGYAIAKNIPVITYSAHDYGVNLMIGQSVLCHCMIWEDLLQCILDTKRMVENNQVQNSIKDYFKEKQINDLRPMD